MFVGMKGLEMIPTPQAWASRIDACIVDLSSNGVGIVGVSSQQLAKVVRNHLDYFQLMLGYDCDPRQVLLMLKHRCQERASAPSGRDGSLPSQVITEQSRARIVGGIARGLDDVA